MTYEEIAETIDALHLAPLGGFQEDGKTLILLGPQEPGFWDFVSTHSDFTGPNPMDHWSQVNITQLANKLGAKALFPFGGEPHHPFISWALKSGEAWQSPVGLLVHKDAGLLVSYRGALQFDHPIALPTRSNSPCESCAERPCLSACPADALTSDGYDVPRCKAHIDTYPICRSGCRVRLVCPVSQAYDRHPKQTQFHMEAFHPS